MQPTFFAPMSFLYADFLEFCAHYENHFDPQSFSHWEEYSLDPEGIENLWQSLDLDLIGYFESVPHPNSEYGFEVPF
jgi:hypothetical protein